MSAILAVLGGLAILLIGARLVKKESAMHKHDKWLAEYHKYEWTRGEDGPAWKWSVLRRRHTFDR